MLFNNMLPPALQGFKLSKIIFTLQYGLKYQVNVSFLGLPTGVTAVLL